MHNDLHGWFKDYAERNNTTMSAVIKDYLYTLRHVMNTNNKHNAVIQKLMILVSGRWV